MDVATECGQPTLGERGETGKSDVEAQEPNADCGYRRLWAAAVRDALCIVLHGRARRSGTTGKRSKQVVEATRWIFDSDYEPHLRFDDLADELGHDADALRDRLRFALIRKVNRPRRLSPRVTHGA